MTDIYRRFEDECIAFDYPSESTVRVTSDPGMRHYLISNPRSPLFGSALIDIISDAQCAEGIRRMLQTFIPADNIMFRQSIIRKGDSTDTVRPALELRTRGVRPADSVLVADAWNVLIDFRNSWVHFSLADSKTLNEDMWTHVLGTIQLRPSTSL